MVVWLNVKCQGIAVPGLLKKEIGSIIRNAWAAVGYSWHRVNRKKHFTKAGAEEYSFGPRSGQPGRQTRNFKQSYTYQKMKMSPGRPLEPLVYSGETRRRSESADIRATEKGVKIKYSLPALTARQWGPLDLKREFMQVSGSESVFLRNLFQGRVMAGIRALAHIKAQTRP